jgi:hypothetical protein
MEEQRSMIRELERDMRVKRHRISALTGQIHGVDERDPLFPKGQEVYAYWKKLLAPGSREFGAAARRVVMARLRAGWTVEELKQAIDGCVSRQFWTRKGRKHVGQPEDRKIDLELICRDDTYVRGFIAIYEMDKGGDPKWLHWGATAEQAALCDCGHAHVEHLRLSIATKFGLESNPMLAHEPCGVRDCPCVAFDTLNQQMQEWEKRATG